MSDFAGAEYIKCKQWAADKIQNNYTWDEVAHLCISSDKEVSEFDRLQNDELIIPPNMEFEDWKPFIESIKENYTQITELYGIAEGDSN